MGLPLLDRWIGRLLVGPASFRGVAHAQEKVTLRQRLMVTMVGLVAFHALQRIPGTNVPSEKVQDALAGNPLLALLSLFTGGNLLKEFSVAATGVFPYLMALSLVSLLLAVRPQVRDALEATGGESARARLELLFTVVLAFLFAYGLALLLSRQVGLVPAGLEWFTAGSFLTTFRMVAILTIGGVLSAEIAKFITMWGIYRGEGVILLVETSISLAGQGVALLRQPPAALQEVGVRLVVLTGAIVGTGLSWALATRRTKIPIVIPQASTSRAQLASIRREQSIPVLYNSTGIQPLAGALGVLALLAGFGGALSSITDAESTGTVIRIVNGVGNLLGGVGPSEGQYWAGLALLLGLFTWAGNEARLWKPPVGDGPLWEQLRRQGIFIPGIRPGKRTQQYLERRIRKLSAWGAGGMALLGAGLPWLILQITTVNLSAFVMEIFVFLQTMEGCMDSVWATYLSGRYAGFLKKPKWRRAMGNRSPK